jgi:putative drug exporter of the RND superfamily
MGNQKINTFGKLGQTITKRKFTIIAVWILLLAIILPIVATATGVTSLQMGQSEGTDLESNKAENIINAQFKNAVSNDSLIIIVSTDDASSINTQQFLDDLINQINGSSRITGIENITSVYSILVPALNQTNNAIYLAYNGGNLTYNLLYSVPRIYSNVWYVAYNTTKNGNLVPGLNQTNQGVYALMDNANLTYNLLYGVPAAYSNVWSAAYNQTRDTLVSGLNQTNQGVYAALTNANLTYNLLYSIPAIYIQAWQGAMAQTSNNIAQSNQIAYQTTASTLQAADPVAFAQYTSPLLDVFQAAWIQSFIDAPALTPMDRLTAVSTTTNTQYINTFLAGNATAQAFATGVTSTFTLNDYLTNTQAQNNAKLEAFAIQTITAASVGQSSTEFVTAAYQLGSSPSTSALTTLAETIIWNPTTYNMGTNFVSTFNGVAYSQTASILSTADPTAYAQYTAPLLNAFNTTWVSLQNPATQSFNPFQRASLAANLTNQQYINNAFASNATAKDFATALTRSFSLENFLGNTQTQNNAQLQDFAIHYLVNQSAGSATVNFVTAAYNLGRSPTASALSALADGVIWYSSTYNMSSFIPMFNEISYNQTKTILKDIDEEAFNNYTSHMLNYFNASWAQRVPNSPASGWINQTAASAATVANIQFIDNYLSDNKDFANQIAQTFSFQDYLNANSTDTNRRLKDLTINYVANESGLSETLITAIYNMGENATNSALQTLTSNIVKKPDAYSLGQQFNSLISSFVSPSKDVTLISITFEDSNDDNLIAIRDIIAAKLAKNPADVHSAQVTGADALNYDFGKSTSSDLEIILPITVALLILATGLFFRSIVTPIITLGTIGVGLGVAQIFPYLVGTYVNQVDYTVTTVLLTVLIGVGTDYSIFIIARHREERINELPLFEAIKKSITWAGESIVTSGATVIISFFALATTSMVMLQTMGLIVGLGVIVTLLVSLTFAPALTAILGDRIFWPNSGERFKRYSASIREKNNRRGGYFARSGGFSVKHGKAIIMIAVLVTIPAFYVYATTTPTFDLLGSASNSLESINASNTLTDSFGGGRLMPTYVVVTFSQPIVDNNGAFNMGEMATLQSMSASIASHEGVQEVDGPTMPFGESVDYQTITNASDSTTYNGMLTAIGADNQSAIITVKFRVDPYSTDAINYAKDIRTNIHTTYDSAENLTGLYLGGTTGGILDTRNLFEDQFNQILPIVALGVGIVLFVVLGSLILPVFAVISVLMSIVWTLAVTVLLFQSVFNFGLLFITPLILFVLLLGLGMDYNIFILTRIREEAAKGQKLNDAIVHAIQQTGGIITAAAIILAGSLGTLLLSSNMMLREMGFAFAFSILIDALVVRTYLVPAVMSAFGKWNWYNPIKRLRRIKEFNEEQKPSNEATTEQAKQTEEKTP